MDYRYLIAIGTEGLESFLDVTDTAEEAIMCKLGGTPSPEGERLASLLNSMALSHRMNSHRKIRTFIITVDIEPDLFRRMCEEGEDVRDLILRKGTEITI